MAGLFPIIGRGRGREGASVEIIEGVLQYGRPFPDERFRAFERGGIGIDPNKGFGSRLS